MLLIPKIFHHIWFGPKPIPREFLEYRKTWMMHHPDWEFRLWTDKNRPRFQNEHLFAQAQHIVTCVDLAKPELIVRFGGVFVDFDFECRKNIEPLLDGLDAFTAGEVSGCFGNGIFGCTPGHPGFQFFIDSYPEYFAQKRNAPVNHQTGPYFFTALRDRHPAARAIKIFGPELFYPYGPHEKHRKGEDFPSAYAVHHWAASWWPRKQ